MMKKAIINTIIGLLCGASLPGLAQQLPFMNLVYESNFVHNPAMTAQGGDLAAGALYHRQWAGFDGAPATALAFAQLPLARQNMGLGLALGHDRAGPLQHSSLDVAYAYHLQLGRRYGGSRLSIGLGAKLGQYHFDPRGLSPADAGDPLLLERRSSRAAPNASAGVYFTSISERFWDEPYFFVGLAANQLIGADLLFFDEEGRQANLARALHLNALAGYRFFSRDKRRFVQPALRVNYAANAPILLLPEVQLEVVDVCWAGLAYASDNTVLAQAGIYLPWQEGVLKIGAFGAIDIGQLRSYKTPGFGFYLGYSLFL